MTPGPAWRNRRTWPSGAASERACPSASAGFLGAGSPAASAAASRIRISMRLPVRCPVVGGRAQSTEQAQGVDEGGPAPVELVPGEERPRQGDVLELPDVGQRVVDAQTPLLGPA